MEYWLAAWQTFLLVLARTASMVMLAPMLGGRYTPAPVKVGVSLSLGLFLFQTLAPGGAPPALGWMPFVLLAAKETLVGLMIGFTLILALAAFEVAGELIGFQMMFSASNLFSPFTQEQTTVTGQVFYLLAMLVFITLDGQHALVRALDLSFQVIPPRDWPGGWGPPTAWIPMCGRVLETGLRLALPLMAALFITNAALGLIARTMPQINVFVIGMPLQIAAGFLVLTLMLGSLLSAETAVFRHWAHDLKGLIRTLAP